MNVTLTDDLRAELEWCIADGNCGPRTRAMLVALRALLAAQQPEPRASTAIPRVHGVGRVADNPCAVLVMLKAEPSDETLRAIHDRLTAEPEPRAEVTEEQPSLTNPLTPYGMLVRALRIVSGTTLMDMAEHLGRGPAELSAIEFGRKPVRDADIVDAAHFFACAGIQSTTHALTIAARAGGQHADQA